MTQEEKAQAYDEALERFHQFKEKYYRKETHFGDVLFDKTGEMQKEFDNIFPELTESEDEKIRMALIEGVSQIRCKGDVTREQMIAYLEKQKEQKPGENHTLEFEKAKAKYEGIVEGKQTILDNPEDYGLCKPAEWSKNDTVFLNEIIDYFENKTVRLQHDIDMYAHWLKSLPERFSLQPKQEWSEEDENLDEVADDYVRWDTCDTDDGPSVGMATDAFKAGAQWQKSQMLKDAMEGWIVKDITNNLAVTAKGINLDGFKFGQNVRIIIVKED